MLRLRRDIGGGSGDDEGHAGEGEFARPASIGIDAPEGATQDELLSRLVELEAKLEADRSRKEMHQKPQLQARWQAEIAELYELLE